MSPEALKIKRAKACLLVVDMQERLLPAIADHERVIQNCVTLTKGAAILGLPMIATEQYRKGLGATVPEVAKAFPSFSPIEKLAFSACGIPAVEGFFEAHARSDVIVCGVEAHVCVAQTCLDLLGSGLRVFVVADATSSRTLQNYQLAIGRMRDVGAIIVSTEMILFELLERAGTEEFKKILRLVK